MTYNKTKKINTNTSVCKFHKHLKNDTFICDSFHSNEAQIQTNAQPYITYSSIFILYLYHVFIDGI